MEQKEIIPHLFRTEFSKITAVLCKRFGADHIQLAEDIAGDTFLLAVETWPFKGIPENPIGWLYTVAKNKAKNYFQRDHLFKGKIAGEIKNSSIAVQEFEIDLSEKNITDSQLQMLFAICEPCVSIESQIALALRILCGFGIDEIATAFLTNKETINKRLFRAKEKLRSQKIQIEFPTKSDIHIRSEAVLATLYLLFSEGYYSESEESILREDLCMEAMRLTELLLQNTLTNQPNVNALYALMCFHSSRFGARKNVEGEIILYDEQDETLWNQELIAKGIYFLKQSSQGSIISRYHLEANIAYWHTNKEDTIEKWENILQLFDQLLQIEYSPIAALNRTYAFSKVKGKEAAITEAEKLDMKDNYFYYTLLGELYKNVDLQKASDSLQQAYLLAKTTSDKKTILKKMEGMKAK
jgi:RNA polymerase sigma-70 factor (ECF subfamily)